MHTDSCQCHMKRMVCIEKIFVLFLFISVFAHCSKNLKNDLILKVLNESHSKCAILLLCWTESEEIDLLQSIHSSTSAKTALFSIKKNTISNLNVRAYEEINFILDLNCPNATKILEENSSYIKFRNIYHWLLLYNSTISKQDHFSFLWNMKLRFDTNMKMAIFEEQDSYRLFDIYKPGYGAKTKIKLLSTFKNSNVTIAHEIMSFYEQRKNLTDVLLRTANTHEFSFETNEGVARELKTKGDRTFEKLNFQLFLCLKSIHQFKYNTTFRNAYFGNTTSGIDAGIAKLVHEKKVDMSTSGGFLRVDRIDYYDFLVPVYKFRTCFIFVNPGNVKPGTDVLKPFSSNTWYAFILTGIFIGIAINIACWVEYTFEEATTRYSLFTSIIITISVLAQQGSAIVPLGNSGRIIFLNLLIFSIIIYNYYTSSLVSSLLSTVPDAINTVKELYESNLKVAIESRPYTITYFIQQKNDRYISLLNRTKIYENGKPNFMTPSEGIAKVKEQTYAYHTDDVTAYSWLDNADQELLCDLAEINFIPNSDIGMVMQKDSEYTELFQISLRKMQTSGIYHREMKFWIPKKPICLLSSRVKSVGLSELFLVYLILCCGILLAIFILCLEIISRRFV